MQKEKIKINNNFFYNGIFVAPLAGYSDAVFRQLAYESGAKLAVCEMISAIALTFCNKKTLNMLKKTEFDDPFCVQLFAPDYTYFVKAVQLCELNDVDIIDINMGCPVPKVMKAKSGAALLMNKQKAFDIVYNLKKATNKIITAKIRLCEKFEDTIDFIKALIDAGVTAIYVHGRSASQLYTGESDWSKIEYLQQKFFQIPIIGNGDLKNEEEIRKKLSKNAIMIGRGIIGNFDLLEKINNKKQHNKKYFMLRQLSLMKEMYGETYAIKNFRKHFVYYVYNIPFSASLKREFFLLNDFENQKEFIENNF